MAGKGLPHWGRATTDAKPVVSDGSGCAERMARLSWLPSLTALSFLAPIVLLYWQLSGPSALLTDPSTGVHIRTGQWIMAHHAIPRRDLFSFTLAGKSWCDWEWLGDVLFAGADRLHGLSGAAVLSLGLLCLTSVVIYRTARLHAGPIVAGAVCALVMSTTTIHWLARPHLFTWLLLAVFCWVLEKQPAEARRRSWVLTCIMILWVNLHPGFMVGFLVLGLGSRAVASAGGLEERRTTAPMLAGRQSGVVTCCLFAPRQPLSIRIFFIFMSTSRHICSAPRRSRHTSRNGFHLTFIMLASHGLKSCCRAQARQAFGTA